ncbi:MAG: response regulator transcription factor [Ktedonobacteraceae bacterium]|nr:response regulator transcription factor [Ktedonobacteraceae bacterium]
MTNNPGQGHTVSVLVVDDQRLMRDGIASLLEIQDAITVVGTASNGQEAIEKAASLRPDVILMDVRMPVMDGVIATRQIRREVPSCRILMLTTFDDEAYIIDALQAGASGYLLKDLPAPDLASAVQAVYKGIYQLDPVVANKVIASLSRQQASDSARQSSAVSPVSSTLSNAETPSPRPADLTGREVEVLRLIAKGATNREIAEHLVISEGTVKNHISNILSRLGLRDRTQAAIYARESGWL